VSTFLVNGRLSAFRRATKADRRLDVKGESCETFNPPGLGLVTADEVRDASVGRPDPTPYLRAGDVVELEIDGLGRARQRLVAA
jgi:2-keto-4-pentenoate hydratase/2-oxohepta-3-ene-1,7-dioic acid hydratase in catechol pathway